MTLPKSPDFEFTPDGLMGASRQTLEAIQTTGEELARALGFDEAIAVVTLMATMANAEATLAVAMLMKEARDEAVS